MPTTLSPRTATPPWTSVVEVCAELSDEATQFAPRFADLIRRQYEPYTAVPWEEHIGHVRTQCLRVLDAVSERRAPNHVDLEMARMLGMRRASQGLPVQTVIGAFQLGNRELWNMIRTARDGLEPLLPEVGTIMWDAILVVTGALADGHAEVSRTLHADRVTLENRFIELLAGSDPSGNESHQVARVLGLDPEGDFQAVALNASDVPPDGVGVLALSLSGSDGVAVHAARANRLVFVGQGLHPERLNEALVRARPTDPLRAGVGIIRSGLVGAAQTVDDAVMALGTRPLPGEAAHFEHRWLPALVLAHADTMGALVAPRLAVARNNPVLCETITAFAEHDLSVPRTAAAMHLHANTVLYRLGRWEALTDWDPRTLSGLIHSLLACWLAEPSAAASAP